MVELNMEEKVDIVSIAPWTVGFPNMVTRGDTNIPASARVRIKREELLDQISAGNKLLVGIDGQGSHATLYIDDEDTRKYFEFDSEDGKRIQNVVTKEKIQKWFELKTQSAFEKNIREGVVTRAEKAYLLKMIKELKLDSYEKIEFCKEYCKFRIRYR